VDRVLRIIALPPPEPEIRDGGSQQPPDDMALVAGLRARQSWAAPALVARYGGHLRRVLLRILGTSDNELGDVLQDVIVNAWLGIDGLEDPAALKSWLTQVAIFTARKVIRRRHRRRWLTLFETVPEPEVTWASPDLREAASCVYRVFDRMPVDERIPLALRLIDGLELDATAAACGVSVATVRRRLIKAERRFLKLARQFEALAPWLELR